MDNEKKYDDALAKARVLYERLCSESLKDDLAGIFPELRESEKPLTPFQQCLNSILLKVYYASVPGKVDKFILDIIKNRTDELVELAKRHEYTDCQLRESEDERIRKELIQFLTDIKNISESGRDSWHVRKEDAGKCDSFISYLEKQKEHHIPWYDYQKSKEAGYTIVPNEEYEQLIKQKEQKPAEWNDTDMKEARDNLISVCRDWERGEQTTLLPIVAVRARYFLEHLTEPKQEWSEEDKDKVAQYLHDKDGGMLWSKATEITRDILEMLRPQPHWKPSQEQMKVLERFVDYLHESSNKDYEIMDSFLEQLKKL